jgi:hypothetical protein
MDIVESELSCICSVEDFCEALPYLHLDKKRFKYLLNNKHENGLHEADCLYRIGRSYGVHRVKFRTWYLEHMKNKVRG